MAKLKFSYSYQARLSLCYATFKSIHACSSNFLIAPLHCDNQDSIYIARNPVYHERMKHIKLDCHFVMQKFLEGLISLSYISTKPQLTDVLTEPLTGVQHHSFFGKFPVLQLGRGLGIGTSVHSFLIWVCYLCLQSYQFCSGAIRWDSNWYICIILNLYSVHLLHSNKHARMLPILFGFCSLNISTPWPKFFPIYHMKLFKSLDPPSSWIQNP